MSRNSGLTGKALDLYRTIALRSSHVNEQLMMLTPMASRVGASTKDVEAVRTFLLRDHVKECRG